MEGSEKNAETQARCHKHVLHRMLGAASPKRECDRLLKLPTLQPTHTLREHGVMGYWRGLLCWYGRPGLIDTGAQPTCPHSRYLSRASSHFRSFPNDNILAGHLLGIGSFSLQTVHPDLPC